MRYFLTLLLLFSFQLIFGQFQKIINQSVEVKNATKLEVLLDGNIIYSEWEGTFILLETKVIIENCNENIFKAFVKSGRYLATTSRNGDIITLKSHQDLGKVIKSKLGETYEDVYFKIYYPKGFKDKSGNHLVSSLPHDHIEGSN